MRSLKFVGSTVVGKDLAKTCGEAMKPATLELGGSDAFIVREDVEDMSSVVKGAIKGRIKACGQACNNSKRFIIHSSVYDQFKVELIQELEKG